MKTKFTQLVLYSYFLAYCGSSLAADKPSGNSPPTSYEECQKRVLRDYREKLLDGLQTKERLEQCKQTFPSSSVITDCNQKAIRDNRDNKSAMRVAIKECKELAKVVDFDPKDGRPFSLHRDRVWFAGSVLNSEVTPITQLNLPNFNCQAVYNAMEKPDSAQFLFTGNQLKAFKGFAKKGDALIAKVLKSKPKKDPVTGNSYWSVKGMGRIYQKDKKARALLYLPTAPCSYSGSKVDRVTGLEIHMLLDFRRKGVTPLFAVVFYSPKTNENSSILLSELSHVISAGSRNFVEKRGLSILSQERFSSDLEGDPQDLCLGERKNRWLAIAKHSKPAPDQPLSYIIVANVKNLCDYGDLLSLGKKAPK